MPEMNGYSDIDGKLFCEHGDIMSCSAQALGILYGLSRRFREKHGKRLRVSSGYRCPVCNEAVGGAKGSAHLRGKAFDVHFDTNSEKYTIYEYLFEIKVKRMGDGNTFVHFDVGSEEEGYIQRTMWGY